MSTWAEIASVASDLGLMDFPSTYRPAGGAVAGGGQADVVDGVEDVVLGLKFKLEPDDTESEAPKSNRDYPGDDSVQEDSITDDTKRRSADGLKGSSPGTGRDSGEWLKKGKKSTKSKLSSMLQKKLKIKSSGSSSSQSHWMNRLAGDNDDVSISKNFS